MKIASPLVSQAIQTFDSYRLKQKHRVVFLVCFLAVIFSRDAVLVNRNKQKHASVVNRSVADVMPIVLIKGSS